MKDPRRDHRYAKARRAWLQRVPPNTGCHFCGVPVNTGLPGTHPQGPTVEHLVPIHVMLQRADSYRVALDWALDENGWVLAHHRCNSVDGGNKRQNKTANDRPSRRW